MNVSLIIAAGGAGKRFGSPQSAGDPPTPFGGKKRDKKGRLSKLFFDLGGRPLLAQTLESFRGIPQIREIIMAVPRGAEKWVKVRVLNGHSGPPIRLVRGGATRAESVWKALLRASPRNEWVLVHDGARPFPPKKEMVEMLRRGTVCPAPTDGFILARPVVPTLKRVTQGGQIVGTVDRSSLFEAETPQLMRRSTLLKAYRENPHAFLATDESSLVEFLGGRVKVLPHSGWNVKVTTPEDLRLAEVYYGRGPSPMPMAVGFGRDTHRLVRGRKLYLGGVRVPSEKGALGHSDGDALLHAVSDAILGAIGQGDIGEWFSDKNPRYKDIRSERILKKVLAEAAERHWTLSHVDTVIVLEKPRLGPLKKIIRQKIATLLHLTPEAVSIKAKTLEGLGPEGEGLAVTCEAIVTMRRVLR